jgi:hypothetical protein
VFDFVYSVGMGTNKRYPSHVAAGIDRGIEQMVTRAQPISLTDAELDKEHQQLVQAPEPIPVRAWVRYPRLRSWLRVGRSRGRSGLCMSSGTSPVVVVLLGRGCGRPR